jgi:hypothetical protein
MEKVPTEFVTLAAALIAPVAALIVQPAGTPAPRA